MGTMALPSGFVVLRDDEKSTVHGTNLDRAA